MHSLLEITLAAAAVAALVMLIEVGLWFQRVRMSKSAGEPPAVEHAPHESSAGRETQRSDPPSIRR